MILGDSCLKETPHAEVTLIAIVRIFIWVVTMAAPFYDQSTLFYNQSQSPLLLFIVNGANKRNVIPATERGDRAIETGWFRV